MDSSGFQSYVDEYRRVCTYLAHGNIGALTVVKNLSVLSDKEVHGQEVVTLLHLANIRGLAIWVLFKDLHDQDLRAFAEFIAGTGLRQLRQVAQKLDDPKYSRSQLREDVEAICGPL